MSPQSRKAFDDTVRDPEFLADAARQNLDVNTPMTGAKVDELIAELYATPQEVIDKTLGLIDMSTYR